jgi:hypothetical protein
MTEAVRATAGCLLVGEYVDEAEAPAEPIARQGEVVRPRVVGDYVDLWVHDDGLREFTVLLKDGREVAVRGHGLKHEPHPQGGQGVYSIVVRTAAEEVLVALFTTQDVSGIFCGEVRSDRRSA